jgi:hypothetical protein
MPKLQVISYLSFSFRFLYSANYLQVDKLVIASTTVPNSAISRQILFVVSVVMPVTWHGIAQTDRGAQTGVMTEVVLLAVVLPERLLAKEMLLTGNMK